MGAVAYDAKVVPIWNGFREWLRSKGFPFDYLLYSNYERLVEDLIARRLDAAWNSPLAWLRSCRLGAEQSVILHALVMRDTDQDLVSELIIRRDSGIQKVSDLAGRVVATGAVDSPQSTLIPLDILRLHGMRPGEDYELQSFNIGMGLHGDDISGERAAAQSLISGSADAVGILDASRLRFVHEGIFPPDATSTLAQSEPFDHCNMTVRWGENRALVEEFGTLLRSMDYGDEVVRQLMDLEGLTAWLPGRTSGYEALKLAVDASKFYDMRGEILATGYHP
jgi:phosphonate transport system substrate-binding protein